MGVWNQRSCSGLLAHKWASKVAKKGSTFQIFIKKISIFQKWNFFSVSSKVCWKKESKKHWKVLVKIIFKCKYLWKWICNNSWFLEISLKNTQWWTLTVIIITQIRFFCINSWHFSQAYILKKRWNSIRNMLENTDTFLYSTISQATWKVK